VRELLGWIAIGLAVWLCVAVVVGVMLGLAIRNGDRQQPEED
jgi:hypothetical protein